MVARLATAQHVFLAASMLASLSSLAAASSRNFTVFSAPIRLRYGEVYNTLQSVMKLPTDVVARYAAGDKTMAVSGFDVEVVRVGDGGVESPVKLSDHYLHHYALMIGQSGSVDGLNKAASEDVAFARMLTGCHAMTRTGLHSFLNQLQHLEGSTPGHLSHAELSVFGSASGAEYRHNPQRFAAPFRQLIRQPQVWTALIHVINIGAPDNRTDSSATAPYSPLLECPCTPQRTINVSAGTIDGHAADPPIHCSPEFAATGNPSCHLATYIGGWRCCEHRMFLVDTDKECASPSCSELPEDEVYMKFTFYYEDAQSETRPIEPAACCDVTSVTQGNENIEYDVPVCAEGTPPDQCIHIAESVQPLAYYSTHPKSPKDSHKADELVDLVFAAPHLHLAGISMELIDGMTNKTICEVHYTEDNSAGISYGRGSKAGDENGYLVGLLPCMWDASDAPRFRRDHPIRSRAVYNATQGHTGVMSLWLMDVSAVTPPEFLV